MASVRPLRRATTPIEGESARGLFCRALGDHGVPLSFTVLRRLGLPHRNVVTISEDPDLDIEEMARVIRVDVAEIEKRRYRALGKKQYSFFGLRVPSSAIEKKVRRFSPGSLASSPYIRAIWELRDLPFCPESWELLIDTCSCRAKQGWIRLNGVHRCDDCGRLLSAMPAQRVPEGLHDGLSIVAGIASPVPKRQAEAAARLPAALQDVDRADLFKCIMRLRRALAGKSPNTDADVLALHAACVAVATWPSGIAALNPAEGLSHLAWSAVVTLYNNLPSSSAIVTKTKKHRRPAAGTAAVERRECDETNDAKPSLIGIRPAYELARLSPETLLLARSRGHLESHERLRGGRLVPVFDPGDVKQFAEAFSARVAPETVGYGFGLGRRAIQEIFECGHITASGISLFDEDVWFTTWDITDFEARIRKKRRSKLENPVSLREALMVVNGRPKPWGAITGALLQEDLPLLPFAIERPGRKLFDAIMVEKNAIRSISGMTSPPPRAPLESLRVTQREAREILNANIKCKALDSLDSAGKNPITYSLADVQNLAQKGVTVLEIATVIGQLPPTTFQLIKNKKIDLVADGLWNRAQVCIRIPGFHV